MPTDSSEIILVAPDERQHVLCCGASLRTVKGRRTVFEGAYCNRQVIIKRFEDFFGQFRCLREKKGLEQLNLRGLSVPAVLLVGKDCRGRSCLVIEKIENASDGLSAIKQASSCDSVKAVLTRIFCAIARMHAAGVTQDDLHLGNFLVTGSQIYAIDTVRMKFCSPPLSRKEICRQLAILLAALPRHVMGWETELLQTYFDVLNRRFSMEIAEQIRILKNRCRRKGLPSFLKKTLRTNKRFFDLSVSRYHGFFSRDFFSMDASRTFLEQFESLLPFEAITQNGGDFADIHWGRNGLRIQGYGSRSWLSAALAVVTRSPARREWLRNWRKVYLGIPTSMPAAFVEEYAGLVVKRSWLITAPAAGSAGEECEISRSGQ